MNVTENNNVDELSCSLLGTKRDRSVCFYFPTHQNYCHCVKTPEPVRLDHQEEFCLTEKHSECLVFKQEGEKHLPKEILGEEPGHIPAPKDRRFWITIPLIIAFAALMTLFLFQSAGFFDQQSSTAFSGNEGDLHFPIEPTESSTNNKIDLLFLLPEGMETSQVPTATARISQNPPTPGPGFSTPVGISQKYLVHQVKSGESLQYIANLYNSSLSSISEINALIEGIPIQENQVIVVKPGATEDSDFPQLKAILIHQKTYVSSIATKYAATVEELIDLNDLGNQDTVPAGRWLIVPVP